jgi:hypothetical protein
MSEELVKFKPESNLIRKDGKTGRPKGGSTLTDKAKAFVDLVYLDNQPYNLAYKKAGYTSSYTLERAKAILNTKASKEYILTLECDESLKVHATKGFLIKCLVDRLEKAKDSDAVNIIKTLNVMLGYTNDSDEVNVSNKIEIVWQPLIHEVVGNKGM